VFPAVSRDLNLVVNESVLWADLAATVRKAATPHAEAIEFQARKMMGPKSVIVQGKPVGEAVAEDPARLADVRERREQSRTEQQRSCRTELGRSSLCAVQRRWFLVGANPTRQLGHSSR
jgi:hypothetical protein